ncbi:glycosyltransferase involved in cell wall biosynthesis [Rubricella aquisinus]|uniref:Glycosyltransferase involved in cell wall biosynthesis n=1 Tax=Rubricella aquisinus TaxID=2028108 RepID=A0A840WY08_9RHOB|nr:glycosyltransferase [Rubricella aquisinus]MBB5514555.1 glycosyltransferase involved in cell wall biosynthesis [Rubricella aquisinus]
MSFVTHIITGLNVGGAERALFNLLTNGLEGPFENRVISLTDMGHYGPLLREQGIQVTCINMQPGRPTPVALWRLHKSVKEHPFGILQGWMIHGNIAASLESKMCTGQHALIWNIRRTLEGIESMRASTRALTKLGARISRSADAVIYNAQKAIPQYVGIGYSDTNAHYLPNGFDTAVWHPDPEEKTRLRAELGIAPGTRIIGFVGRRHPDKDPDNLLDAFGMLQHLADKACLVMVGRDLERPGFDPARVKFLGQRTDIQTLMQGFDVLCLSSQVEGFPNVIGEAMATAVPCVTTDVGDARSIVSDTGWVAPPRDPQQLALCLQEALSTSPAALKERGEHARARIVTHFSIEAVVERYVSLYRSVTKDVH